MKSPDRRRFLHLLGAGALTPLLPGIARAAASELPPPSSASMNSASDLCALQQLASAAAHALVRDDSAAFAALFTADAILDHDTSTAAAPQLAAWHAARRSAEREHGHFHRFQILTPVIDLAGNEARLTAHCTTDAYEFASRSICFRRGWLRANARRDADGAWRFSTWSVRHDSRHFSPPPTWLLNGRRALAEIGHPVPRAAAPAAK